MRLRAAACPSSPPSMSSVSPLLFLSSFFHSFTHFLLTSSLLLSSSFLPPSFQRLSLLLLSFLSHPTFLPFLHSLLPFFPSFLLSSFISPFCPASLILSLSHPVSLPPVAPPPYLSPSFRPLLPSYTFLLFFHRLSFSSSLFSSFLQPPHQASQLCPNWLLWTSCWLYLFFC